MGMSNLLPFFFFFFSLRVRPLSLPTRFLIAYV